MALSKIWVHVEVAEDVVAPITLEVLAKARTLTDNVEAFVGGPADAIAEVLGAHGATKVLATGDLEGGMQGVHLAAALAQAIEGGEAPDAIFFGSTYDGRDIVARLSVKLDKPVITNNTDVEVDGDSIVVSEPIFGGTQIVKTKFAAGSPALATFRPKSFVAEESGGAAAEVAELPRAEVGAAGAAKILDRHVEESIGPKLDEAAVVVAGGRGLGEADKFSTIEELAKLLKGAPGASRAIVDAGWVPYSYQVGQTGKVVKPTVYIAAGISGATQHMVGMKGSKNIVAINKDPEAPILGIADLGIVGDVHKVLPKLIEALKAR
ncbi:electron transfer flavoprotein subunit alpha/FixB family protein [Iamia sp.]|uniref:electron transfer flavoprotein subunit alpha/FixB family protein n=1 Tax=Iamia sp. TaxID=2722710 RepID=UPI002C6B2940|nr:electron transfer flavoprotein subunit alpha/FixB family protein [Iamia sp.]HXH55714.1 electron transfer flavoprotein subunit alpha/FixB family protein [Iamia sp.]